MELANSVSFRIGKQEKDYANFAPPRDKRRVQPDLRAAMKFLPQKQGQPGHKGPVQWPLKVASVDRRLRRKRSEHRRIIPTLQGFLYAEGKQRNSDLRDRIVNDFRMIMIAFDASSYDGSHQW